MTYLAKGAKTLKETQSAWYPAPFSSSLSEGPLQKGIDITQGGAGFTNYGFFLAGLADNADSLGVHRPPDIPRKRKLPGMNCPKRSKPTGKAMKIYAALH